MPTEIDEDVRDATAGRLDEMRDKVVKDVDTTEQRQEGDDRRPSPRGRLLTLIPVTIVAVLAAVGGWLGLQAWHAHQQELRVAEYLQAARQGALNLTTISWQHVDDDVRRILDSSTGAFHDDFEKRSQPFVDVVKRVQSDSKGEITLAAVEFASDTDAQVLVALNVTTTLPSAPQQDPRAWRMRIALERVGDETKVSNVEFVP